MSISVSCANSCASHNGKYTYISVLGVGSFGTVQRALNIETDEVVAIKIVKVKECFLDFIMKNKSIAKRGEALQEVEMLVQLKHNNIVALLDFFEFRGKFKTGLAIVMEFCENGNLQEYLEIIAPTLIRIELPRRKLWYTQLSCALQFIHSKGIIHRDLKPPNILLDKDDNLKIADVGLAKTVWEAKTHCHEIPPDTTFDVYMSSRTGTPIYMAPEVWDKRYKMNSDVFSLGLIFVMIAVIPNPPVPYAYWDQNSDCLGKLVYEFPAARRAIPTDLLNLPLEHLGSLECNLFNGMLSYNYQERISIDRIIEAVIKLKPRANNASRCSRCLIL